MPWPRYVADRRESYLRWTCSTRGSTSLKSTRCSFSARRRARWCFSSNSGEGCGATLNGLYLGDGDQHIDHQTRIEHVEPNCYSRELYKGILDGSAHGVFNGKVYVHPEAQKTDGKQTNNTLLLSEKAQIDTKPQLEIFADDVKCTHGAAIGQLDEDAVFYLRARGLTYLEARDMLIHAFAGDILNRVKIQSLRIAPLPIATAPPSSRRR